MANRFGPPDVLVWRITDRCDLDCAHCSSHCAMSATEVLSTRDILVIADQIAELGCRQVLLSGGEPLLRKDWRTLAAHLTSNAVSVSFITNGQTLSLEDAHWAAEHGISRAWFSVDGLALSHDRQRRHPGAFFAVERAIRRAHAAGLVTAVITTVTRTVLGDLRALHAWLRDEQVAVWQVRLASQHGEQERSEADGLRPDEIPALVQTLLELAGEAPPPRLRVNTSIGYYGRCETILRGSSDPMGWNGCTCGLTWCSIEPNGDVRACGNVPRMEGNLFRRTLAEIWMDPEAFPHSRRFTVESLGGACRNCAQAARCRGGCWALASPGPDGTRENLHCLQHPATGGRRPA